MQAPVRSHHDNKSNTKFVVSQYIFDLFEIFVDKNVFWSCVTPTVFISDTGFVAFTDNYTILPVRKVVSLH